MVMNDCEKLWIEHTSANRLVSSIQSNNIVDVHYTRCLNFNLHMITMHRGWLELMIQGPDDSLVKFISQDRGYKMKYN